VPTIDRTSLVIPGRLRRWAKAEAKARGVSFAQLVRLALEKLLEDRLARRARDPLFADLPAAARRSRKPPTFGSAKHDEVMRALIRKPRSSSTRRP